MKKKRLSKKAKIIIASFASFIAIFAVVLTILFLNMAKNNTALNKEEPNISETHNQDGENTKFPDNYVSDGTDMVGGEKKEFDEVVRLEGDSTISPEREILLEPNIIKTIDFANSRLPILNEEGNYYTDENGNLVCYAIDVRDYTGMKENLIVIVNAMADAGYPIEPIWYAQRLYFECYDMIDKFATQDMLDRIMTVFAKTGNTVESVAFLAKEHLEIERTDNCSFVFDEVISPSNIIPTMDEVRCNIPSNWKDEYQKYSIYDRWVLEHGESEYKDNQIQYLHIIVYKMVEMGVSEYDIRLAQLIYSSYLSNVRYRSEWLTILLDTFSKGTPNYVLLCQNMNELFGADMNGNQEIADYYDGISTFYGGEVY